MLVPEYDCIVYELIDDSTIARITLNRPEVRNAQNRRMLAELDDAFTAAAKDDRIKVIVLAGVDPHFSSGHDLTDYPRWLADPHDTSGGFGSRQHYTSGGFGRPGAEGYLAFEEEAYFQLCRRWQGLPKPTIAEVQGKVIAGGLMLAWVCDLIIASEDAQFCDLTVAMGVNGVEWFAHPWELGVRKAKEMLFTGDWLSAQDAFRLGMVNHVVPRAQLGEQTLALARRIATKPTFALKLAKQAVNQALEAQGFWAAQQAAFALHHLGHSDMRERGLLPGLPVPGQSAGPA
jgi:enoyl-CoA hydratase